MPTEAEWEYAARAGDKSSYDYKVRFDYEPWDGCCRYSEEAAVGLFPANNFGLHDLDGNVDEWTQDCWNRDYQGAPEDGVAWLSGDCRERVVRGNKREFHDGSKFGYSAIRYPVPSSSGGAIGFRLAMSLQSPKTVDKISDIYKVHLTIKTSPENAQIRIVNIDSTYQEGMALKPGNYHIEVSHEGYRSQTRWLKLVSEDRMLNIALTKQASVPASNNPVAASTEQPQPEMVDLPGGCFRMKISEFSEYGKLFHPV